MSRSRRKTPIVPACGARSSNKKSKRIANRTLRSANRQRLTDDMNSEMLLINEVSSRYDFKSEYKFRMEWPIHEPVCYWYWRDRSLKEEQDDYKKMMRK